MASQRTEYETRRLCTVVSDYSKYVIIIITKEISSKCVDAYHGNGMCADLAMRQKRNT